MKVLTVDETLFKKECSALYNKVMNSGNKYDLVIGIITGGAYVGRCFSEFNQDLNYIEIKVQRDGTKLKQESPLKGVLKKLPYFICNQLRIVEHLLRCWKGLPTLGKKNIDFGDICLKKIVNARNILLVDDAIDTGATIKLVCDNLKQVNPMCVVHSAVLTSTMKKNFIEPTYWNYKKVLIRFPWSFDFKNEEPVRNSV